MLPTLLATYRKYGSAASACRVRENQRCSNGAVAAIAKNGRPSPIASSLSSDAMGASAALAPIVVYLRPEQKYGAVRAREVHRQLPPEFQRAREYRAACR
jgi:hypothetical protein